MARPRPLTAFLAALLLGDLVVLSVVRLGPVPRLGPFLDPVRGVWAVAADAVPGRSARVVMPGLARAAEVLVDDRGVPHIFAATEDDAYRVMGYVVARDRLFQLELQARAGAGTLTELVGTDALESDRGVRESGLAWGAERKLAGMDTASHGFRAIAAYAAGVNAYIEQAGHRLPLEYHLLGRRPARWDPVNTLYLFSRMGQTLASGDPAVGRLAAAALVGTEAADAIAPRDNPIQEPIQPNGRAPRYALRQLPPPGPPARDLAALAALVEAVAGPPSPVGAGDAVGSNNWAVGPGRTRDGHALLAGDPHLELTLPSIWYEVHLVVPGRLDVAGVSLPGSPGVVIGFNRDLAWTFTNTGGDVLDLYRETVDDSVAPTRYRVDGEWRALVLREEVYRNRAGRVLATDTVRYTHRGPMRRREGEWMSRRWTVLEPSAETDLFLRGAQTRTAEEWLAVMAGYVAPTQNGLVADRTGTIAIRSAGAYPVRPGDGRGDLVRDGSTSASDWVGMLPVGRYPYARNPAQGFLVSANQQPVDPLDEPAYLGADWIAPWRALRINALLRAEPGMTVDRMRAIQTDPGSARADAFVPFFLAAVPQGADDTLARAARLLAEWDRTYRPDDRRAVLFELAMDELERRAWDELFTEGQGRPVRRFRPEESTLLELLNDPGSRWWDDRRTFEVVEGRDAVVAASLREGYRRALSRYGDPDGDGWRWGVARPARIDHLLRIPALGAAPVPVQGGPSTIAPNGGRGTHGPSWRMVVELGEEVRGWATYPGGQSGNPASPHYQDRIPQWSRGELDPVLFPRTPAELPPERVRSRLVFTPGGA